MVMRHAFLSWRKFKFLNKKVDIIEKAKVRKLQIQAIKAWKTFMRMAKRKKECAVFFIFYFNYLFIFI